jgi:hypothetical protein
MACVPGPSLTSFATTTTTNTTTGTGTVKRLGTSRMLSSRSLLSGTTALGPGERPSMTPCVAVQPIAEGFNAAVGAVLRRTHEEGGG